jgi:hypothetical protein
MYLINKDGNNIEQVEKITFKSEGLKERQNLQEWIAKNPESQIDQLVYKLYDLTSEEIEIIENSSKK